MSSTFLISDAAKQVSVEAHVLRYWEEELKLPIKRNELGHRYYTEEDIRRFMEIKDLKERGLQLKAIRMVLKNGKLDRLTPVEEEKNITQVTSERTGTEKAILKEEKNQMKEQESNFEEPQTEEHTDTLQVISTGQALRTENGEDKIKRLQWLLQQMFREVVQENNATLCQEMKESVLKELDYQFRMQEEKEEERNAQKIKRDEEHYKKIDELLRKKRRLFKK
ncbi:MAG: MerR family transcriptional regulator [Lachnospiraceae bacterium]|nr:MerR family transcriptional regulator [Lachnospiraceae bacterium]MBQ7781536.1 MerR family transcriptional regulator [Lachnospiraceae bacterium]